MPSSTSISELNCSDWSTPSFLHLFTMTQLPFRCQQLHKVHRQREPEIAAPTEAEEATFSHKIISSQLYHKQRQDITAQEEQADVSQRVNQLEEVDIDDAPKKITQRQLAPVNYKKMFHPK